MREGEPNSGEQPKIEYQKLEELFFQEVSESDAGFDTAREVNVSDGESAEDVLKNDLRLENWWLDSEWQEKGLPKEQVEISFGNRKIDVYNFNQEKLSPEQLDELRKVIQSFHRINGGVVFDKIRYILISDKGQIDPVIDKEQNGAGAMQDRAVKLYPVAMESGAHRVKSASNFEGTLIHEFTHSLQNVEILHEWQNTFWDYVDLGKGKPSILKVKNPEKCISDYAWVKNPSEDICESMVAVLTDPDSLDPERLKFLKEKFFTDTDSSEDVEVNTQILSEGAIKLPAINPDIKYKKSELNIKIL